MEIIELRQVTKTFGTVTAVHNLDLKVPAGTIYGFIGPNGSGKTTTAGCPGEALVIKLTD